MTRAGADTGHGGAAAPAPAGTPERGPRPAGPPAARGGGGPSGRRAVLFALIALTVLVAGGTWAVYGSSWFRAERVAVTGTGELTTDQVERAAAVPLGGPLVSVDTDAVRHRLLTALPRIDRVEVARSWPHTVTVKVTERTPSAVLHSGRRFTEVDRDGVRFATVDRAPAGVPLVQLTPVQSASLRHFGTTRLLRSAITVSADLPAALRGQATAIRVRSYDGITVELTRGRDVVWGSAVDGVQKAAVLTALMKAEPDASHFDVSAPMAPAVSGS
ncbi:cell division protein FtsQ/DivIB [Actinacidiphila sp. ITFR-21]|uniref:cell division protein FtsQ/DivIB n=1 Tax=Actinacidiphila sp. ITFR-21 TaxID=3075199 RepID=UPI0028893537|nr:FtsQ-type POTRA domain-containing protein [Streptomyces sp. ITFR-21]WNI15120.1 FtsQ-type POTRA domain-containing protein [Streptomyces sp. ITFR-21]